MPILYALTKHPTPVFNTPELASCFGNTLPLDEQNLLRAVETVLFPQTLVRILETTEGSPIWKIATDEYPYSGDFYIDRRFAQIIEGKPVSRNIILPSRSEIKQRMTRLVNARYIWGGNWPEGIDILPKLYPSKTEFSKLEPLVQDTWQLKGVDCSGLIHYATNGFTPRNTSALVRFGKPVEIEGKDAGGIVQRLQPLDLIVWAGHVVCVLDSGTTIESIAPKGVVKRETFERLSEVMKERQPVNNWDAITAPRFVVRRWFV